MAKITELKILRAVVAHQIPDFDLEAATEHMYTDHKGDLVYMPPAPRARPPTLKADDEDTGHRG